MTTAALPNWVKPDTLAVCPLFPGRIFRVDRLRQIRNSEQVMLVDGMASMYPVEECRPAKLSDLYQQPVFKFRDIGEPLTVTNLGEGRFELTDGQRRAIVQLQTDAVAIASFCAAFDGELVDLGGDT